MYARNGARTCCSQRCGSCSSHSFHKEGTNDWRESGEKLFSAVEIGNHMEDTQTNYWKLSTLLLALILVLVGIDALPGGGARLGATPSSSDTQALAQEVVPEEGGVLPICWGDLGARMGETGVIDEKAFGKLYTGGGGMSDDTK